MTEHTNNKKCPFGQCKGSYAAFQGKMSVTNFSPALLMRFQRLANVFYYIGNTKAKANPVKLFQAESVVLSSLMIRAFVQFSQESNQASKL